MSPSKRSGRTGDGIIRRGKTFAFRVYLPGGGREWFGKYPTHKAALDAKKIAEADKLKRTGRTRETCGEFANRWLEDYNAKDGHERWQPETVDAYRGDLKRFREEWGSVRLDKIPTNPTRRTERGIETFDEWIHSQPRGSMTVLAACLEDARRGRLIHENPVPGRMRSKGKGRKRIHAITEEELWLLGECAFDEWEKKAPGFGPHAQAYYIWQGTVGTRPIAVRYLRPDHVDLGSASVYLAHPGKKVAPRTVYIPPQTVELLRKLPRRLGADWYFTTQRGCRLSQSTEWTMWQPVRVAFENRLPAERQRELQDSRRTGGSMESYELRHAAATIMRRRGADWETIAYQLGHTDKGEQARTTYSHLTERDQLASLRALYGTNVADLSEAREASA